MSSFCTHFDDMPLVAADAPIKVAAEYRQIAWAFVALMALCRDVEREQEIAESIAATMTGFRGPVKSSGVPWWTNPTLLRQNSRLWMQCVGLGRRIGQDVDQGFLGDCWFMSSLAAIATQSPDAIRDMARENGDGTYPVMLFWIARWKAVVVDADFVVNDATGRAQYAGNDTENPAL